MSLNNDLKNWGSQTDTLGFYVSTCDQRDFIVTCQYEDQSYDMGDDRLKITPQEYMKRAAELISKMSQHKETHD